MTRYSLREPDGNVQAGNLFELGDGSKARRGDLVDLTEGMMASPDVTRVRGQIVVIETDWAWVQWPSCPEPYKYRLIALGKASAEPLPDFRTFFSERQHTAWPGKVGESYDHSFARIANALADYADEIRKRTTGGYAA